MALNTIYNAIDSKVFEQIKDLGRASKVWKRLEETYEGTPAINFGLGSKLSALMIIALTIAI